MRITLGNFDRIVSRKIARGGMECLVNDGVREVEQNEAGRCEAKVVDTEIHNVSLSLVGGALRDADCSCPYNAGPLCKHIVAVAFYLRENADHYRDSSTNKKKPKKKELTVVEQVNGILNALEYDELKEYVKQLALKDVDFRSGLTMTFAYLLEGDARQLYARQVEAILNSAMGNDGFIGWRSMQHVYDEVLKILEEATQRVEQQDYQSAIGMCCAVMEEMLAALQFADDSNGDVGACIEDAIGILHGMAFEDLPRTDRAMLLQYCIDAFKSGMYKGWDWHMSVLELAVDLAESEQEIQEVLGLLNSGEKHEFGKEHAQFLTLCLLEKAGAPEQVEKFIAENIANPEIRLLEIDRAFGGGDYARAEKLARDGIKRDAKDSSGYLGQWYESLLKIARRRNDKAAIIESARYLFLHDHDNPAPYYTTLKKHLARSNWSDFVEELVKELEQNGKFWSSYRVADIYIREKWWPRLMQYVEENASFELIQDNEKYLKKSYSTELAMLYRQCIVVYLEKNVSRSHYERACKYIRRMRKLGEAEMAQDLIEFLKHLYPRRPALLQELNAI